MNKIYKLAFLFGIAILFANCNKDDGPSQEPLRDYQEQYNKDIADIELYLKSHSYTVIDHPGFVDDQDVIFTAIPEDDTTTISVWDSPILEKNHTVSQNDITYKLYYLKLREGGGALNDKPYPCNVDAVLTAYKGSYLFHYKETENNVVVLDELRSFDFETVQYPQGSFNLGNVIKGWGEVFPQFKAGDFVSTDGQPTSYSDFGAGVMFLPSGLGYYGAGQASIPAYSPLIFSFKLYEVTRLDHDNDGIPSYLEDLNGDRYLRVLPAGVVNPDDTDGDGIPDFLDVDDDGDNVLTRVEIRNPVTNLPYDFASIPTCSGGTLPKHRDPSCQ